MCVWFQTCVCVCGRTDLDGAVDGWMGQVTQPGQVDSLHLKQAEKLNHSSSLPLFHDLLLPARCCFISRTPPARCFHAESDRNSRHFLLIKKP